MIKSLLGDISMKKFIRNLFSGYFLIILLLLLEVGALIFMQSFLDEFVQLIVDMLKIETTTGALASLAVAGAYLIIRGAAYILAFIVFFTIVNRMEDPELKIPWIVGMLLFPFFCSILFLIFGRHSLRKKIKSSLKPLEMPIITISLSMKMKKN